MEIKKNVEGAQMTIVLEGRLDTTTAPQLEAELGENLNGIETLVMDFANLAYISSAGLRVLLGAQKAMNKSGGEMFVENVCDEIGEVFEITGFSDILTIR